MLPAASKSSEGMPLELSRIPLGTTMTVYYVGRKLGKQTQNVILAIRLDHVRSSSGLPQGVVISCVKGTESSSR
jgi:hypothetical protein